MGVYTFRDQITAPEHSPLRGENIFKNVIAHPVDLLVEIYLPSGMKIFIDVATQL
jgi:hypothetical protein